jgi:hypothetical protein
VLAPETISLLEGGCGVIIGTVGPDGAPHVSRGWGITVVSTDPVEMRVLLDVDDAVAVRNLRATGRVAVTGGDIRTLDAIQFKGEAARVETATDGDRLRAAQYTDDFFGNISAVDGTPLDLLRGLGARDYAACVVRVEELYDQSPGPGAGTRVSGPTP